MAQNNQNIGVFRFFIMLPSYRFVWVLLRVLSVSTFAIATLIFARNVSASDEFILTWDNILRVVVVFNLLSELNILLDNIAERIMPIPKHIYTRIVAHIVLSILIGTIAIAYFEDYLGDLKFIEQPVSRLMIVFGLIFVVFVILFGLSIRIAAKWVNSQKEVDELKQAQLRRDYNALQDQLNPHFLFNNLSVLKSMILYDQGAAVEFTQNFTDVYRYVLQSKDKTTVKLGAELQFIQAYLGLHKERLGEGLQVKISVAKELLTSNIPPLSLQLLVENAIKHNIATKDEPLNIEITTNDGVLLVVNNLNLKESSYSTQTGLKNLKKRYELLADISIEIAETECFFKVTLPLIF